MGTHRLLAVGAMIALGVAVGCASEPNREAQASGTEALLGAGPSAPARDSEPAPDPTPESADGGQPDSADLLARRAQEYALALEQRMGNRTQGASPSAQDDPDPTTMRTTPPAPESSSVQWRQPAAPPVIDASPSSANQAVRIPETPDPVAESPAPPAPPRAAPEPTAPAPASPALRAPVPTGEGLGAKFAKRVRDNPRDIAGHLDYQLLRFLQDEQVPDLSALSGLPQEDREMLAALLDGLSNFRSVVRSDNNMLLSRKIQPLVDMDRRLRNQSELTISTLALCTKVESFGVYEPIDPARFVAGRDHSVIVYCAIDNFASQFNDKKLWETRLTQESVLYTESGLNVWSDKTTSIVDLSRQRRNDFFIVKMIKLPGNLTIGRYLLKVTVIDQQASRVAEATIPLQIVAK